MRKDHLNIILAVSILALSTTGCHKTAQNPEAARVISFVNEEMFKNPDEAESLYHESIGILMDGMAHQRQQCPPEVVSRREHGNAGQVA
jgi:hypothetical protein